MMIFDDLTAINGGSKRIAEGIGAYYLPDGDDFAKTIREHHPRIQLATAGGEVVGVAVLPPEETPPEETPPEEEKGQNDEE